MATGEAIVRKAFDDLRLTITPEDVRMFSDTSLEDLWREARKVEQEQGARMDLRFMRRLEPFLRSLESYAGVIEVFCQGYSPMALVWVCRDRHIQLSGRRTETSFRVPSS